MLPVPIADHEPHGVDLVRVTLEDERVRVLAAQDAAGALLLAGALRPDLLLLEVGLPGRSGLEVCAEVKRDPELAAMKIVMLTAAAQEADVRRGLAAGADQYLTKPFSPVRLLSLVESPVPCAMGWRAG